MDSFSSSKAVAECGSAAVCFALAACGGGVLDLSLAECRPNLAGPGCHRSGQNLSQNSSLQPIGHFSV
jgi:hypothetical protein